VLLFSMNRPTDNRKRISREEMQAAITEAVKKADPDCEPFIGVIVERTNRSSLAKANWAIRGIKFGRAAGCSRFLTLIQCGDRPAR
jgi:hypothetical protein